MPKRSGHQKYLILHLEQMENLLLLGVPILKHITVNVKFAFVAIYLKNKKLFFNPSLSVEIETKLCLT